jgi:hypothetical protein
MVALLLSAAITAAPYEADLEAVAALPGEPHTVAAAGVRQDETPILTLENPDAFDDRSPKRRVVVFSSGASDAAADAVVRMARWFKRDAPRQVRDQWALSALPAATFDAADTKSFARWMTFQAPDVAIEVTDGVAPLTGAAGVDTHNWVLRLPLADDALASNLRVVERDRSAVHDAILARARREPLDIAKLLGRRYPETPSISYIPALAWVATLRLADIVKDETLREKVVAQTKPWVDREKPLFPPPAAGRGPAGRIQLTSVAGAMIFDELHANDVFDEGVAAAEKQKAPGEPEYGQGWTDDMFMAASVLARSGVRPGHERDMDAAARLLTAYAARLQQPDGLFHHAVNGPAAWGRGNGFAALGLVETLSRMPESHPARRELLDIYRRQMAAVRANQSPDGSWRQIIDEPGAYREETATAMLLTAMARGIRRGWLDGSFRPSVDRAWRALAAHVAADGTLVDVCAGTGAGPTRRYYFDRPAVTGADDRGGAMALLAALETYEIRK